MRPATRPATLLALITPAAQLEYVEDFLEMIQSISGGLPAFQVGMVVISLHEDAHPYGTCPPTVKRIALPQM
jgi:hypothetical protein